MNEINNNTALQLLRELGQLRLTVIELCQRINQHLVPEGYVYTNPLYKAIREIDSTAGAIALNHLPTTPETTP